MMYGDDKNADFFFSVMFFSSIPYPFSIPSSYFFIPPSAVFWLAQLCTQGLKADFIISLRYYEEQRVHYRAIRLHAFLFTFQAGGSLPQTASKTVALAATFYWTRWRLRWEKHLKYSSKRAHLKALQLPYVTVWGDLLTSSLSSWKQIALDN
jgi:hypothetical protein